MYKAQENRQDKTAARCPSRDTPYSRCSLLVRQTGLAVNRLVYALDCKTFLHFQGVS